MCGVTVGAWIHRGTEETLWSISTALPADSLMHTTSSAINCGFKLNSPCARACWLARVCVSAVELQRSFADIQYFFTSGQCISQCFLCCSFDAMFWIYILLATIVIFLFSMLLEIFWKKSGKVNISAFKLPERDSSKQQKFRSSR
jgi:hypothetical protein